MGRDRLDHVGDHGLGEIVAEVVDLDVLGTGYGRSRVAAGFHRHQGIGVAEGPAPILGREYRAELPNDALGPVGALHGDPGETTEVIRAPTTSSGGLGSS